MNLRISDPKIEELAQELANRTGETLEEAMTRALEERLARQPSAPPQDAAAIVADRQKRMSEIMDILARIDKQPVLDNRSPDELLYDEDGLPR